MARILVLSPHPDDEAIGCGGTLASHAAAGDDIHVIYLTSGERGSRVLKPREAAYLREKEAEAAAGVLGVAGIEFWREPDCALMATASLVRRVGDVIRIFAPDYLYTTHIAESHSDHRAATRMAIGALRGLPRPWPVMRLFEVWTPLQRYDFVQDISGHMGPKILAVRCYASQCANLRYDEAAAALNRYRGAMHNEGGGEYAEAFLEIREAAENSSGVAASQLLERRLAGTERGAGPGVCKT